MNHQVFVENCRNEFSFLKNPDNISNLLASHVQVINGGYLVPLTGIHLNNDEILESLWSWREEHYYAYPSRNKTTIESTRNWIQKAVIDNPDRILFLIYDERQKFVGHAGFADAGNADCELEFDNILRGDKTARKGLMADVMATLENWARTVLFPNGFYLRVLESNKHAVTFYNKIGFVESSKYGLVREDVENGYRLIKAAEADQLADSFIVMKPALKTNAGKKMILTAGPSIGSREKVYALDAATKGWNNEWSKYLTLFEKKFAEYVGVKYAIATSSCTGALHISLNALGIGPGDEVIVPEVTWVASANAIRYVGATPVFADVDKNTWNVSAESIRSLINERTKAIIPVHLYGNPCDMDPIMQIAKENNLYVVEDAAPSIGAEYKGKKTGSFGHFAAFSFQGAKLAVTGEGGMICTNDDELYKKAYRIWDQGRIPGTFWIEELGVKYKMSNIQAALGLGQLMRNDAMVEAKRRINEWYKARLGNISQLDFWQEEADSKCIYWMTNIRLNENATISRDEFCKRLKENNVDTRPVFPPISQYPYWPKKQDPQPVANEVGVTGINLPSGVGLTKEEVEYVCDKIIEILK
ncbi:MAG: aminotransferase class I/II-fold pyridoxal phosphate-dependent enzyme [Sediminibacterium sp. Gen4]|jgi:perosamine synthetase|uniref:bifunctional GNAT family N-acetyltransferase/PLP-dependent aspartate aminotransferase family protein n=1 Tax=unclassified Sediminibacterium TaxID=2635961 RepID=UPI0015C09B9C|nr:MULTISPECIES: aminotransferase class I/II-fold pyridoxal phosphate-dependent enzyme [unclassified Sediminibacterium]MBW0161204.1 aminotransferase class I/II-fold pyridoxal phosphate-dependent enzyme [Sediminibacterium sp.]MBW0163730.1 aminotransferase class I/II-fold pyridoxal phosphate-dependent enzyme [Sediminibacterium sp.]NWK66920.1 aminotransferase class I/II-fold pyridoxal phosphate-dependent enzyme [Sediminibacterium sp. Gen4]